MCDIDREIKYLKWDKGWWIDVSLILGGEDNGVEIL